GGGALAAGAYGLKWRAGCAIIKPSREPAGGSQHGLAAGPPPGTGRGGFLEEKNAMTGTALRTRTSREPGGPPPPEGGRTAVHGANRWPDGAFPPHERRAVTHCLFREDHAVLAAAPRGGGAGSPRDVRALRGRRRRAGGAVGEATTAGTVITHRSGRARAARRKVCAGAGPRR